MQRRAGAGSAAGPFALARVHGRGGGAAAARLGGRTVSVAARSGAPVWARRQLGAAAATAAGRGARSGAAGGVPRAGLDVVGGARVRAVGARQRRARSSAAGPHGPAAAGAVDARAQHLVRAIPLCPARQARTHGRAPAAVHRQHQRTRARACGQAIEGRTGAAGGGGVGVPAGPARARAQFASRPAGPGGDAAVQGLPARARGAARGGCGTEEVER